MRITHAGINRLAGWINEQLLAHTTGEREKPVHAFALMHVESGIAEREVKTIKIGVSASINVTALARALFDRANEYASEISSGSGMQQFIVYAHVEGVEEFPHWPLRVSGNSEIGLMGTEPATEKGFLSQLMRHNEALVAAVVRMNDRLLSNQESVWQTQEQAMSQRLETLQLTEAVITKAAEGEHQKRLELLAYQRKSEERQHWMRMLPAGAKMLGLPVPESAVDSSILEAIANDLTADDLEAFLGLMRMKLKPEVMAVMQDRLGKIIDEKRKADAMKAQANGEMHETQ